MKHLVPLVFVLAGCASYTGPYTSQTRTTDTSPITYRYRTSVDSLFTAAARAIALDGYNISVSDRESGVISTAMKMLSEEEKYEVKGAAFLGAGTIKQAGSLQCTISEAGEGIVELTFRPFINVNVRSWEDPSLEVEAGEPVPQSHPLFVKWQTLFRELPGFMSPPAPAEPPPVQPEEEAQEEGLSPEVSSPAEEILGSLQIGIGWMGDGFGTDDLNSPWAGDFRGGLILSSRLGIPVIGDDLGFLVGLDATATRRIPSGGQEVEGHSSRYMIPHLAAGFVGQKFGLYYGINITQWNFSPALRASVLPRVGSTLGLYIAGQRSWFGLTIHIKRGELDLSTGAEEIWGGTTFLGGGLRWGF